MFKLVVALALIAACGATYDLGQTKTFTVDVEKDFFKIVDRYGNYIVFSLEEPQILEEPRKILIQYYGQDVEPQIVRVLDEKVLGEDIYQSEFLYKIFQKYSGQIDTIQYEKILEHIREYVQKREIHPVILYALRAFIGDYEATYRILEYVEQTKVNKLGYAIREYKFGDYSKQYYQREQIPYNRYGFLFGKKFDYNRNYYNRDYYRRGQESYYPYQYGLKKDVQEHYYGPYNTEYQYTRGLYHQTPYKGLGYLYGKGYGYDKTYSREYDLNRQYPTKYEQGQEYVPYNREYQQVREHYNREYPEHFYGQYPKYGYQYGKTYDVQYPQQYQKSQEYHGQYPSYQRYGYQYGKTYDVEYPQQYQKIYGQRYRDQYVSYPRYQYQYGKTHGLEYPQQYEKSYAQEYYGPYATQNTDYSREYRDNLRYQRPYYL